MVNRLLEWGEGKRKQIKEKDEQKFSSLKNVHAGASAEWGGTGGLLERLVSECGPSLGERHWLRYNTEHHLMSASNATADPMAAVSHARAAIAILQAIYPANHSEQATMQNALAHSEWQLFRKHGEKSEVGRAARAAAFAAFEQALRIIRCCYGDKHEAYVEVAKLRAKLDE